MFIRDQYVAWGNHDFIEASQELKPKFLARGIDLQLDWYAVWRGM
jgi:hypothetical protein